jgi:hypothetical protein
MKIQGLETIIFDANLSSEAEIRAYLLLCPNGTAHPFTTLTSAHILLKTNCDVQKIDITHAELDVFLTTANLSEMEGLMAQQIDKYSQLADFREYSIVIAQPGETYNLRAYDGISIFSATNKINGNYFDFEICCTGNEILTYSNKNLRDAIHSGDIGSMLQTANLSNVPNGSKWLASVVGFRRKALHTYAEQQPAVVMVDRVGHRLIVVSIPLDRATIGADSTFAGLVGIEKVDEDIVCTILPRPVTLSGIDTGDPIGRAYDTAMALADETARANLQQQAAPPVAPHAGGCAVELDEPVDQGGAFAPDQSGDPPPMCNMFVQSGMTPSLDVTCIFAQQYWWGLGFSSEGPCEPSQTVLSHIFGQVDGSPGIFGKPTVGLVPNMKAPRAIVFCDDTMTDQCAKMKVHSRGNGCIFIVKTAKLVGAGQSPEQVMNHVVINAATAMAGPLSIVLVCIEGQLYWYRGIRFPGLVDVVPTYGTDVSDPFTVERINEWIMGEPFPFPVCVPADDRSIYWDRKLMSYDEFIEQVKSWLMDLVVDRMADIIDVLTQLSVQLDSAELTVFSKFFTDHLEKMVEQALQPDKDAILEVIQTDPKQAKHLLGAMKGKKKKLRGTLNDLASAIANLSSQKGLSKKVQSIARMERKAAIASNVDASKNMSSDDIADLLEEVCESMVCMNLDPGPLRDALRAVSDGTFMPLASTEQELPFMLSPTLPHADPDLIASLLELTRSMDHDLSGSTTTLGYPLRHDYSAAGSVIPFPVLTRLVKMTDPSKVNWATEANESVIARLRILMRGTFASSFASRDCQISASSDQLGYFLIFLILRAMKQIKDGMMGVPNKETDWDSTNCEAMRGLCGLLFSTMASTAKTLSPVYKLVYDSGTTLTAIPTDQWWIVRMIVEVFPYTCWDSTNVIANAMRLASMTTYRAYCLPACMQMQWALDKTAVVQKQVMSQECRQFSELICTFVLGSASDPTQKFTIEMVRRLLERCPSDADVTHGIIMMKNRLTSLEKQWQDDPISDSLVNFALFSWIKHSGMDDAQKYELRTRAHAATTVVEYSAIYTSPAAPCQTKWSTTDWSQSALDDAIASVRNDKQPAESSQEQSGASEQPEMTLVVREKTWVEVIEETKGSSIAVTVARAVVAGEDFPTNSDMERMIVAHCNLPEDGAAFDQMQRQIVEAQLKQWRDRDGAIDAGVNVITSFYKTGTGGETVSSIQTLD